MSPAEPISDAAAPSADPHAEASRGLIARMEKLSDKMMAMAMALPEDGSPTSVDSMVKLSRGIRLTTTLEAGLHEGLAYYLVHGIAKREETRVRTRAAAASDATPNEPSDPDDLPEDPYAELKTGAKARARELMVDVIDHEVPDPEDHDTFLDALDERLLFDDAYTDVESPPMRDVVEHLCGDLKLKPNWARWSGDGWKPKPAFYRRRCSLFTRPSSRAILQDHPDPDPLE